MLFRDTWIEVDLDAIRHNVSQLIKHYVKPRKFIAVVKADAYGHGAVEVARCAIEAGADYLAVATLDEAIELRLHQIRHPILILGNVPLKYLNVAASLKLTLTIHSFDWLKKALSYPLKERLAVQIKLDTGMHRIGLLHKEEVEQAIAMIQQSPYFHLTGIYSHLATADEEDSTYYELQLKRFKAMIQGINTTGLMIHLANSMATVKFHDTITNAVRVGILIYGVSPLILPLRFPLKPALRLYTSIIQCKKLKKGSKIGYNGRYETPSDEWIGTLPIGYADGFQPLERHGLVYLNSCYVPIVGKVCMDQSMVRLPYAVPIGTQVEIIGSHIAIMSYAQQSGMHIYQALTQLSRRLPRVYIQENQVQGIIHRGLGFSLKPLGDIQSFNDSMME